MVSVVNDFSQQATWMMVGIYHSNGGSSERAKRCHSVFAQVKVKQLIDRRRNP